MTTRYQASNIIFGGSSHPSKQVLDVDVPADVADEDVEDFIASEIEGASGALVESFDFEPGRPMTGFLALLTDEQRTAALAYCGDDTHGELEPKAATGAFAEGTANEVDSNGLAVYINP